jgi:hypothetical protein
MGWRTTGARVVYGAHRRVRRFVVRQRRGTGRTKGLSAVPELTCRSAATFVCEQRVRDSAT